jgi:ABC-2 type transport system permease protein
VTVRGTAAGLRREAIGFAGIVERNTYLIRRFAWWELAWFIYTVANTLTIVFIAKGVEQQGVTAHINELTIVLLIGAVVWSYLGLLFEIVTETVAWERWEGTIEYTFMAPISRPAHLLGMGAFAVGYGVIRTVFLFGVVALSLGVAFPHADFGSAVVVLAVSSFSFVGIGTMTAVLPLISPEKGTQLGFIAQGLLLVVSGVYYPVSVLPQWMQWVSVISPATYTLEGCRKAILDDASVASLWSDIWPLLVIGTVAVPLGLWVFNRGERYAKRHGRLKRSG